MHFCRYSADTHAVRKAHQHRNQSCTAVSAWLHSCKAQWERSCDFTTYKTTLILALSFFADYFPDRIRHFYNSLSLILARPRYAKFMERSGNPGLVETIHR